MMGKRKERAVANGIARAVRQVKMVKSEVESRSVELKRHKGAAKMERKEIVEELENWGRLHEKRLLP
jgi:FixJ family two-component response regulator